MFRQMLMPAIVGITWLSEPRKPWLAMPIAFSQWLTMPRFGSSIHIHSSASTAFGTSHGSSTMLRTTTDCVSRCISTAIASASDGLDADVDDHVLERDPERVPEQRVLQQLPVVVQADPAALVAQQVEVGEAQVEAAQRGIGVEDDEADRGRQQEQQRGPRLGLSRSGVRVVLAAGGDVTGRRRR